MFEELDNTLDNLEDMEKHLRDREKKAQQEERRSIEVNRAIFLLTYKSSENLLKHSNSLNFWTKVIGVSTILLFISAVLQLVKLFFFSQ